jgi:hypothetical protein
MNYLQQLTLIHTYWKSGSFRGTLLGVIGALALGLASCAQQSTSPSSNTEAGLSDAAQASNSSDAADILAASVGTSSGGSGMVFSDAMTLAKGGVIADAIVKVTANDTIHSATVTRTKSKNNYDYSGTWTHTWTFYDASGNAMPTFVKGQTDKIVITSHGQHTVGTPRVGLDDSSSGTWTISNLIAEPDSATLNGTLTRAGETTRLLSGKTYTHSFTMNWTNDVLVKVYDPFMADSVTFLLGTGSSDFNAVGFRDSTFSRQVSFIFNGDGTATLTITRTSGNGKTDTFTINVRYGIWLRVG